MSVFRIHYTHDFTVSPNALWDDPRLSWRAKGVQAYLLGRPDGWRPRAAHLAGVSTDGRDAVLSALRELEDAGWIRRERVRDSAGRLGTVTHVYGVPQTPGQSPPACDGDRDGGQDCGSTGVGEPVSGGEQAFHGETAGQTGNGSAGPGEARSTTKKERASKEEQEDQNLRDADASHAEETLLFSAPPTSASPVRPTGGLAFEPHGSSTEAQATAPPGARPAAPTSAAGARQHDPLYGFAEFWGAYPARNGKRLFPGKAKERWKRLTLDERRAAFVGARNYADAYTRGLPGVGAMDAFRWLRDRCWDGWQTPALRLVGQEPHGAARTSAYCAAYDRLADALEEQGL